MGKLDPEDRIAIVELHAEYNRAIDSGEPAAWAKTFTLDGMFLHPARVYAGRVELEEFVTQRTAKFATNSVVQQQHWNNHLVIEGGDGGATSACRLLIAGVSRESGKPEVVARGAYEDRLIRTEAGWRFKERRLVVL